MFDQFLKTHTHTHTHTNMDWKKGSIFDQTDNIYRHANKYTWQEWIHIWSDWKYKSTHTHAHIHKHGLKTTVHIRQNWQHTFTHTDTYTYTHIYTHMYTHTNMDCKSSDIFASIDNTYMHTCIHTWWTGALSCWKCHWPDLKSAGLFWRNLFLNSLKTST